MSSEIDESEYEYSEEKRLDYLAKAGVPDELITNSISESDEFKVTEIEKKQLCIYIRNYDSDGNLIDNPSTAIKTCIDTFERTVIEYKWNERESHEMEDGSVVYTMEPKKDIKESVNGSIFLKNRRAFSLNTAWFFAHPQTLKI